MPVSFRGYVYRLGYRPACRQAGLRNWPRYRNTPHQNQIYSLTSISLGAKVLMC